MVVRSRGGHPVLRNAETREEFLEYVINWTDPNPAPVIEEHEGFHVIRDDLLKYGAKIRFVDPDVRQYKNLLKFDEIVFGGANPHGYGPVALAYLCKKYGIKAVFFMAARKELTPQQQLTLDLGGEIHWLKMGMLNVCLARAAEYVYMNSVNGKKIYNLPLGLESETTIGAIIKTISSWQLPDFSEIWCVASSGTLSRGLQFTFPDKDVNVVQIGHKMNEREIGRAKVYESPYKWNQKIKPKEAPPYPSTPYYDAKVWPFVKQYAKKGALIYNVA